ncbi:hypothetical protein DES53_10895 [Roseimicrobium gellanilyticum]|uniref:Uncharacterized protein n=1 Tax=Roseimicrobium gellanilyticum TaxID=748857 RepID=A0A366HG01_9BACT|nr:hypothetical protein [Roseimicrobium gellanilyticum]RBP40388.1 hypothetical protein DES53_10895 [Roseimicrobium gellanilyticum]
MESAPLEPSRDEMMLDIIRRHIKKRGKDEKAMEGGVMDYLESVIHGNAGAPWLKGLMKEMVQFWLTKHEGHSKELLAAYLARLIRYKTEDKRERVLALLPPAAKPALEIVAKWEENSRWRASQEGY